MPKHYDVLRISKQNGHYSIAYRTNKQWIMTSDLTFDQAVKEYRAAWAKTFPRDLANDLLRALDRGPATSQTFAVQLEIPVQDPAPLPQRPGARAAWAQIMQTSRVADVASTPPARSIYDSYVEFTS